jgi:Flp pilus assembly pilin Flp
MSHGSVQGGRRASVLPQAGHGLVEYGLILGLAALVTVIALVFFGGALAAALSLLGQAIDSSR